MKRLIGLGRRGWNNLSHVVEEHGQGAKPFEQGSLGGVFRLLLKS